MNDNSPAARLEYLRSQLDAECISMGELIELQGLAEHIAPGDVQLLEAAGVPEFPAAEFYGACGVENCADCLPRFDMDNNEIKETP